MPKHITLTSPEWLAVSSSVSGGISGSGSGVTDPLTLHGYIVTGTGGEGQITYSSGAVRISATDGVAADTGTFGKLSATIVYVSGAPLITISPVPPLNPFVGQLWLSVPMPVPTFSPSPGWYSGSQNVVITHSLSGSVLYYTVDNTNPTTGSAVYSSSISVTGSIENILAFAYLSSTAIVSSTVTTGTYYIGCVPPLFSPTPGLLVLGTQSISLSTLVPSSTIYFTTDGTTATTASTTYSSSFPITGSRLISTMLSSTIAGTSSVATASYDVGFWDLFSGTADTTLLSHTPSTGSSWANMNSYPQAGRILALDGAGRVYMSQSNQGGTAFMAKQDAMPSPDYDVFTDVVYLTNDNSSGSATQQWGVCGRVATSLANTAYIALYVRDASNNYLQLYRMLTGSSVTIGSQVNVSWSAPSTHTLGLTMRSASITMSVDGVPVASATNSDITASGYSGLYHVASANASYTYWSTHGANAGNFRILTAKP